MYKSIHKKASYHKKLLEISKRCACFYCLEYFVVSDIREWIDNDDTALCPVCGIDAVLPYKCDDFTITKKLLKEMNVFWFGCPKPLKSQ